MRLIIDSQDLPEVFDVGTYDGGNFSINDALEGMDAADNIRPEGTDDDVAGYFAAVVDCVADALEKDLPGFTCLRHTRRMPKEYNYSTDSVAWEVEIPEAVAREAYRWCGDMPKTLTAWKLEARDFDMDILNENIRARVEQSGVTLCDVYENNPFVLDYFRAPNN
jgi:hypothetical protein